MKLNVAVQMDPIARINVRGDSTFALLLEAQKRGHGLSYYTPDKLSLYGEELVAPVQLLGVRDEPGDHFTLGEPRREPLNPFPLTPVRPAPDTSKSLRLDSGGHAPAVRSRLYHLDAFSGADPPQDAGRERSGKCAQRAGKTVRDELPEIDAADTDLARPRRDQRLPRQ